MQDELFGDVWERPGLSRRDRSLITAAKLLPLLALLFGAHGWGGRLGCRE